MASLIPHGKWKTHNDVYDSDHFPIIMSLFPLSKVNKFKLKNADWEQYANLSEKNDIKFVTSGNVNKEFAQINKLII